MLKLFKHTKNWLLPVIAIIVLLFCQAICDLTLPQYTSKIVDTGIQQGGIEDAAPEAIRESSLETLKLFMTDSQIALVDEYYTKQEIDELSSTEYNELLEKYPAIATENIYLRSKLHGEKLDELNAVFSKPDVLVYMLQMAQGGAVSGDMAALTTELPQLPEGVSINDYLSLIPQEQRLEMISQIDEMLAGMSESIIDQAAVLFVKNEYVEIGMDTDRIQTNYILITGAQMLVIALFVVAATILVSLLSSRLAASVGRDLRQKVFSNVVNFSNSEFDNFSTASLITRSTNDIQQVQFAMTMLMRTVFYAPIMAVGGIIKVLGTNVDMSWIIVVVVLFVLGVIVVMFTTVMPKFKKLQLLLDRVNLVAREILTGLNVIRAFSTEKHEEKRFDEANTNLTKTGLFVNRAMSGMMPLMMLAMNGVSLLIIWFGAKQIDIGAMQVGDLMAFIQYTMHIVMSFIMISMMSIMLPRAQVSAVRINEVIESESSIKDPASPKEFDPAKKGEVEFRNVTFRYPNAEDDVLSNISFVAKAGETTAIIGSTGSGKSTLVNLIPRFYDVTEGEVLVDGQDIRSVTQHQLRERIGFVPQKGVLFSGTIESNIKYGAPDISDEEMEKSARIAQATDFIEAKEDGYQDGIAQGGSNVSGGQKQRLAIARAVAKKPEIFVFDDSFSALDFKTDIALRRALKAETENSTVIIIAQRVNTILQADQILVLDEGKLVGKGTHKELMENCEVYVQIAASQLSKEELER